MSCETGKVCLTICTHELASDHAAADAQARYAARNIGRRRQVTGSSGDSSNLREALGCIALLVLFVACMGGPAVVNASLGPWAGLGMAVGAFIAWAYLGPPPMPGLLPGMLTILVLLNSVAWTAVSIVLLIRG